VTIWLWSAIALIAAITVPVVRTCRGRMAERLVAVQMMTALTTLVLIIMSFAFDAPSLMDLPLTLVLLGIPGMLLMAVALERWI
jgi:multisubunit Na+/H+ antiporter MnhF subunit